MIVDVQLGLGFEVGGFIGLGIFFVDLVYSCDFIKVVMVWCEVGWCVMYMSGGVDLGFVFVGFGYVLLFFSWYGYNFDVLCDCLVDLGGDMVVLWIGWQFFECDNFQDWGWLVKVIGQCFDEDEVNGFVFFLV